MKQYSQCRLFASLFALLLLVAACTPAEQPDYMVMLKNQRTGATCAGILADERHIITADHCLAHNMNLVIATTSEATVTVWRRYPAQDVAILVSDQPLIVSSYAVFALPDQRIPATAFGTCPLYSLDTARTVIAQPGLLFEDRYCQVYLSGWPACGGDSGGAIVQDGNVIGLIQAVNGQDTGGAPLGNYICASSLWGWDSD